MFILDTTNTTLEGDKTPTQRQLSNRKHKYFADVPIPDEAVKNPLVPVPQSMQLRALFMGLIKQKHWIYFLNEDIQLRAEHLPILQVRLKQHHIQSECIERIALSGHCSAIVIESNKMSETQLQQIQSLCIKRKVQLIFLENLKDNDRLH